MCNFFHPGMSEAFDLARNSLRPNDMPVIGCGPIFAADNGGADP
jgi:hypothetical protein